MNEEFLLVTPEEVMEAQRYEEEDREFIVTLLWGATAYLQTAGAYVTENPLTKTALHLIVGHWLENRDMLNTNYVKTGDFPIGVTAIVNSLQYAARKEGAEIETS